LLHEIVKIIFKIWLKYSVGPCFGLEISNWSSYFYWS